MTSTSHPSTSGAITALSSRGRVAERPRSLRPRSPQRRRVWARAVHLVAGLVLGTYVYAPAAVAEPLHLALQVVLVPAVVLSGLFMWKQAQIRRLINRRTVSR